MGKFRMIHLLLRQPQMLIFNVVSSIYLSTLKNVWYLFKHSVLKANVFHCTEPFTVTLSSACAVTKGRKTPSAFSSSMEIRLWLLVFVFLNSFFNINNHITDSANYHFPLRSNKEMKTSNSHWVSNLLIWRNSVLRKD